MHTARIQTIVMWILLGMIALLAGYQYLSNQSESIKTEPIDSVLAEQIAVWENDQAENDTYVAKNSANNFSSEENITSKISLSSFDPNEDNMDILIKKGVPKGIAKNIVNYRNAGGKYYKAEQLKKLYAMNDSIYSALLPYVNINLPQREYTDKPNFASKEQSVAKPASKKININTATAADFESQKGIGPAFAGRIVKFRDILGGFYSVEQIKEVYGFPDSTYQLLRNDWIVNADDVKKIDINTATYQELALHPYIGKQLANEILKYIKQKGHFSEINNLTQVPLLNEEKYRKIAHYIKVIHN